MKHRELINLPLGSYTLTDGIYEYTLTKRLSDSKYINGVWYSLRQRGSLTGGTISMNEILEDVFDDSSKYKATRLSFYAHICGITVMGDAQYSFRELRFKPKTTYSEFCKKYLTN